MKALKVFVRLALTAIALTWGIGQGYAQTESTEPTTLSEKAAFTQQRRAQRVTREQREAAAARQRELRKLARSSTKAMDMPMPPVGDTPDYFGSPNWAFSPALRKFVDTLPGLGPGGINNLQQYIPVAVPDKTTYPGSDYYEIAVVQYKQKMHSDLPATTLRGYVQIETPTQAGTPASQHFQLKYPNGTPITDAAGAQVYTLDKPRYLGPIIVTQKDRPVRLKFTNYLPTGTGGDLFIPVDTTVMGAGMGPLGMDAEPMNYTQNRATIHLHGGRTPWISDGTPHQWITPAGEDTPYKKGVSVQNVPDMPDPGENSMTFYFTNQQSARLMFYHDHSWGITRLNVYAGEAAGYLIEDEVEKDLVDRGVIPAEQIPLIIQDKTFVDAAKILDTDPLWRWGSMPGMPMTGDLWYPHVYSSAQNPYDLGGANPYGRWHYGPWFWPPTTGIPYGPKPNPYYDEMNAPWQPPEIPGVPHPSMPGESFMDTPIVNGTAFPTLTVEPKAYRLRILNAANDRFWNLQLYVADSTVTTSDNRTNTEVKMVPAQATVGFPETWPTDGREGGVPDPATVGPSWIQIGTEGGFLPKPVVIPNQPITWNLDPTTFNFGNVDLHSLLIAPAERADVIVDFSAYAGQTLILYNDAPAAFPALDARYDYYTGAPDLTETGGHRGPQAGFGPNTRTIMQIKVEGTASPAFTTEGLEAEFASNETNQGVFARGQDPIVVGQSAYNSAYNATFPATWPNWGVSRIQDTAMRFKTVAGATANLPMQPKAIQDEMGEAFDDYGRMNGRLGLELPNTNAMNQNFILQAFIDPATEIINDSDTAVPIGAAGDGTQIWKITHNGVDTHPIHFHLFDVQLINRVGWDGAIRLPDENELGWKDTVRVSPLEDTIVAFRPISPKQPFGIPDSVRPLDPSMPIGSTMGFTNINTQTADPINPPVTNEMTNFGWEYVWHCHILSHEEMDMMRPVIFNVGREKPSDPTNLAVTRTGVLTWTDPTPKNAPDILGNPANEIYFLIERATNDGAFEILGTALANTATYTDTTVQPLTNYSYRVSAYNAAGFSLPSNVAMIREISGVSLAANPAGQTLAGRQITLTATPTYGYNVEYRFFKVFNGVTTTIQPYTLGANTIQITPTDLGQYQFIVWAREQGSASKVVASVVHKVNPPLSAVTLAATPAAPQQPGTQVTLKATPVNGGQVEYRFYIAQPGGTLTMVRQYSTANTYTFTPQIQGSYQLVVYAREVGSNVTRQAYKSIMYTVATPITSVDLAANPPSPKPVNTPITLNATAQGGYSVEYRFFVVNPAGATQTLQQYTVGDTTCTYTPAAPGKYTFIVYAREVGSPNARDAYKSITYTVQ